MRDRRIGIVGLGLIGGSLALALKGAKGAPEVWGHDPDRANLRKALASGAVARRATLAEMGECDLVAVCVPVAASLEVICEAASWMRPGAVLTDGGSVKAEAVEVGRLSVPDGVEFVGGHPIAGTERSGFAAADGELFRGRTFITTPHGGNTEGALRRVERLWRLAGARTLLRMDPGAHDRVFAWVSHLPHAVAYSLVHAVATLPEPVPLGFSAGGFRDFTRIASSSPRMWSDIFLQNRKELLPALKVMREDLSRLEKAVRRGDEEYLLEFLGRAKAARDGI